MFIVTPDTEDVIVESATATNGEPQGRLVLSGARVVDRDVLGGTSADSNMVDWMHQRALACYCATAVGVFDRALRITAGYLSERREGTTRYYRANKDALGALRVVVEDHWRTSLTRLKMLAETEQRAKDSKE